MIIPNAIETTKLSTGFPGKRYISSNPHTPLQNITIPIPVIRSYTRCFFLLYCLNIF